jgi:uncharacterized Zn finger protein
MGWQEYGRFPPYVSKAEKIRKAEKVKKALMKKKGVSLEPIVLNGSVIARTWWGKSWNQNLERYADYAYRLGRGRSYVRCGSVIDLKITCNTINALVMGSAPKPYKIDIFIQPIERKHERALMEKSRTSLDSMQAMLAGEFPGELKEEFFRQGTGLFPSPKEIRLNCSCPDIATMCKHVAAAMYGVSARLDARPGLFFELRGIKIEDFVGTMIRQESEKMLSRARVKSIRTIKAGDDELSALFGIEMDGKGGTGNDPAAGKDVLPESKEPSVPKRPRGRPVLRKKECASVPQAKTAGTKVRAGKRPVPGRPVKTARKQKSK